MGTQMALSWRNSVFDCVTAYCNHAETQFGKKYEFVLLLIHFVSLWLKSVDKDSFIAVYSYEWQRLIY